MNCGALEVRRSGVKNAVTSEEATPKPAGHPLHCACDGACTARLFLANVGVDQRVPARQQTNW